MAVVDTEVRHALHTEIESPTAKLVYLSLAQGGRATVADLQERVGEPRLRLYGVLDALEERGLVAKRQAGTEPTYAIDH